MDIIGPGRAWLGQTATAPPHWFLGGWQIAGVTLFQTGRRFTPSFTGLDPSNTNVVGGRPDRIANGNPSKSQRTIER